MLSPVVGGSFLLRLELRVEASSSSSSSSGFVELFSFSILFPGLVRRIGLFLELDPRKNDASTGRIGASSNQHVLRSAGGFAGPREGSRRLDPARSHWSPGPDKLKTTRGGKVRVKL